MFWSKKRVKNSSAVPIYHISIEDYLKPKSIEKTNSPVSVKKNLQKSQLSLRLLEHPVLVAGHKTKWDILKEKTTKDFNWKLRKFAKAFKISLKNKIPKISPNRLTSFPKFALPNLKLPKFLKFLHARNDQVVCKRKSGFEIYCEIASIHGFINFVGATTWQRAFWFSVVLLAVIMSGGILLLSHYMNTNTPTILYSENPQYPSWSIPFPAVTICNLNQISKRKAENLAAKFQQATNLTLQELTKLFNFALFTTVNNLKGSLKDYKRLNEILTLNNYTMLELLDQITPDCQNQLLRCIWQGHFSKCEFLFRKIQTSFGQCCSFNYNALKKVHTKRTDYVLNDYLQYVTNCGYLTGLSVLLDPQIDDYKACLTPTAGFQVLIHDSHDYPNIHTMQRIVTPGTSNKISIRAHQTYATDYISSAKIETRRCYLPNERKMFHFGSYSQTNCLAECHSSKIYEKCHCTLPHIPRMENWTLCDLEEIKCYKPLLEAIMNNDIEICDCYPLCDFNLYSIDMDSATLTRNYSLTEKRLYNAINVTQPILLRVYLDELHAERLRLDVYENWLSFIATFGGITGLYMGYSLLSGFELIFLVFIRPACNWLTKKQIKYRREKREKKLKQEEERKRKKEAEKLMQETIQAWLRMRPYCPEHI